MQENAKTIIEDSLEIGNQVKIVDSKSLLEEMEVVKKVEDNINIEKAKIILVDYVDNLKLPKEIEPRILNMYLKEMEHIYSMMQSVKSLKPFKRIWCGNEFNSNDFLVENEEDLTNKAIKNVNKIFRKFIQ